MECVKTFTGGGNCDASLGANDGTCGAETVAATCITTNNLAGNGKCVYTGGCGTYTAAVAAAKIHHVPNTNADVDMITDGVRATLNDATSGAALAGNGLASAFFETHCMNDHYYQFGFYNTGTPRWNREQAHRNFRPSCLHYQPGTGSARGSSFRTTSPAHPSV